MKVFYVIIFTFLQDNFMKYRGNYLLRYFAKVSRFYRITFKFSHEAALFFRESLTLHIFPVFKSVMFSGESLYMIIFTF